MQNDAGEDAGAGGQRLPGKAAGPPLQPTAYHRRLATYRYGVGDKELPNFAVNIGGSVRLPDVPSPTKQF